MELPWLRWWDNQGNLLFTGAECTEIFTEKLGQIGINSHQE